MSRWVVPAEAGLKAEDAGGGEDKVVDRIVKYVPAEVVSAFTLVATGLVAADVNVTVRAPLATGLIALFLVTTIIYVATRTPAGPSRAAHLIVSPISFLAWAYPISSAALGDWFIGWIALAAQAVVLALSILVKPTDTSGD